jgi:predicted O-linked N-acetylglucosamine transferase (SPINDLY family)
MAASILKGALPKDERGQRAAWDLIVSSNEEYETKAVELGRGMAEAFRQRRHGETGYGSGSCRLLELRRILFEARRTSGLFDTRRWVRDLEDAYAIAWARWVRGEGGDIYLDE